MAHNPPIVHPEVPAYRAAASPPDSAPVAANDPAPYLFGLAEIGGEPRVRDLDLAERLGFDRPRKIRELIERNIAEIEGMGSLAPRRGKSRGQVFTEYWLNEEQALLVAVLSNAPQAKVVRAMLVRTFVAYRRGQMITPGLDSEARLVIGGIVKGVVSKAIQELLPAMVQAELAANQYAAVRGLTAGEVLDMAGFKDRKGLRGLSRFASDRLRRFHAEKGAASPVATLGHSTAYVFDKAIAREWLRLGGRCAIEMKIAEKRGQGCLKLAS